MTTRERLEWAAYKSITEQCAAILPNILAPGSPLEQSKLDCQLIVGAVLDELMTVSDGVIAAGEGEEIQDDNGINCFRVKMVDDVFRDMIAAIKDGK